MHFVLLLMCLLTACSTEEIDNLSVDGNNTCRLIWDANIVDFGRETRANFHEKRDGDCVYLRFKSGNDYVEGKAVYRQSVDEWILTYDGSLAVGETSTCYAYYIDKVSDAALQTIDLTTQTLVCCDLNAEYTKGSNYVKLSAYLTPSMSRIRFKGEVGKTFLLSGIKYNTSFNTKSLEFKTSQTPLELTVGTNGFTEYVHALPLADRTLTIYYDYQTFKTSCDSPILDAGRSGYMTLPTESAHNGWNLVKVELPTVSAVTMGVISDVMAEVNASVVSLGNGTLLDAGFVYSEKSNPTKDTVKVSSGAVSVFTSTLHDLKPLTEYVVRAYATNERGVVYGEQITFMTKATPTIPTIRTGVVSDTLANKATVSGTIVDLGEVNRIVEHGHVWSKVPNPTISDNKTTLGITSERGEYISILSGLSPSTMYYVRAYATNEIGTSYGEEISFTTAEDCFELETTRIRKIKHDKAIVDCKIISKGIHSVLEFGVCWSTTSNPSIKDNKQKSLSSLDSCSLTISGLYEKTTYYASAYAKIETGEYYYGNVITFRTSSKDTDLNLGEYGDDEDWSTDDSSDGIVDRNEFGDDENWSKDKSDDGNVGRTNYNGDDEDWSKDNSNSSTVNKDSFENDEDWSTDNGNNNTVNVDHFGYDEDWSSK